MSVRSISNIKFLFVFTQLGAQLNVYEREAKYSLLIVWYMLPFCILQ